MKMLYSYSIMRLDKEHINEYCDDIEKQVKTGVCSMPLFCMTLTPEGDPAINKAKMLSDDYREYRKTLSSRGIPSGALIQASIGHGWKLNQPSAFQKYTGLNDGSTPEICCPLDEDFRAYIRAAAKTIASEHPDHIMLDDDFRLMYRPQRGCACPLHMADFNKRAGVNITREELFDTITSGSELGEKYKEIFVASQIDSLIGCAREIRAGIDEADPKIPGSFCAVGASVEGAYEIAKIMAGDGNPVIVRINNGNYNAQDPRDIAQIMTKLSTQSNALSGKPDAILAETDTCPQNRYSTSASKLHTHYTLSILAGAKGAKHWITRLSYFEPKSGEAYRKKLASHYGFYEELARISEGAIKLGCKIPMATRPSFVIERNALSYHDGDIAWAYRILDRLGLPMHTDNSGEGVIMLGGTHDTKFTDEEIKSFLSGKAILDAPAAMNLIARGFGEYLGVNVAKRADDAPNVSGDILDDGSILPALPRICDMKITGEDVRTLATGYHLKDGKDKIPLFPTATLYENSLGGTVVTLAGSTIFDRGLAEGFRFLCEGRKNFLAGLLSELSALPAYYPDDAEAMVVAARLTDGSLMVVAIDTSLDEIENFPIATELDVKEIRRLLPSGEYEKVGFKKAGDRIETNITLKPYDPQIFILKQ